MASSKIDLIFDAAGERLSGEPLDLAEKLAEKLDYFSSGYDVIDYAVRNLGFVQVITVRNGLLIKFEPSTVSHLAAYAAFYEIVGRAPKRLILAYPGMAGYADHFEIVYTVREALRRVEASFAAGRECYDPPRRPSTEQTPAHHATRRPSRPQPPNSGRVVSFRRRDGLAVRILAEDCSKRMCRPVDSISSADGWFGSILGIWRYARRGFLLPSIESLGSLDLSDIACGRAHVVDTRETEPTGYWFLHWGAVNSYGSGHTNQSLGGMPAGLMRDNAMEDYWEIKATGVPAYHLIRVTENSVTYSYARLLLPLAATGRRVDRILVLINERDLEPEIP